MERKPPPMVISYPLAYVGSHTPESTFLDPQFETVHLKSSQQILCSLQKPPLKAPLKPKLRFSFVVAIVLNSSDSKSYNYAHYVGITSLFPVLHYLL